MSRQLQLNTANELLAQNLTTLSFDELVSLCLIKKANPSALPSFGKSLQNEIIRRYDDVAMRANPSEYAVLQSFANGFADPVSEFEHALRTMYAQINKDIWFTNNREQFTQIINDGVGVRFLMQNQEILQAIITNDMARAMALDSYLLIEAIAVNASAYDILMSAPNIWGQLINSSNVLNTFLKSSQIIERIVTDSQALNALLTSSAALDVLVNNQSAMNSIASSSTAMSTIAASGSAMGKIARSNVAMSAINASQIALDAIYDVASKFTKSYAGWSGGETAAVVATGHYLLVRIKTTSRASRFPEGSASESITVNGRVFPTTHFPDATTHNIKAHSAPTVQHDGLIYTQGGSIEISMYNTAEIAYIKVDAP